MSALIDINLFLDEKLIYSGWVEDCETREMAEDGAGEPEKYAPLAYYHYLVSELGKDNAQKVGVPTEIKVSVCPDGKNCIELTDDTIIRYTLTVR